MSVESGPAQIHRRDAKSAENRGRERRADQLPFGGMVWWPRRVCLCTAIDQFDRSLRVTSQTKGTAEYAEYAENGMDWVPTSAYFAYSAVSAAALPRCGTGKTPSSLPVSRLCSLKAALLGGRSESALYGNSDMIHLASAIVTVPGRAWSAVSRLSGTRRRRVATPSGHRRRGRPFGTGRRARRRYPRTGVAAFGLPVVE